MHDEAILTLRQYRFDEDNACKFVDYVYKDVFGQIYDCEEFNSNNKNSSVSPASSPANPNRSMLTASVIA